MPRISLIRGLASLAAFVIIAGCHTSTSPQPESVTKKQEDSAKRAITQITQTLNIPAEKSWSHLIEILSNRKMSIAAHQPAKGFIQTHWIPITDKLCGSYPSVGAPLSCKVVFTINVRPISRLASEIHLQYVERCLEHDSGPLECPDSKAEKLLLAIVKDLKKAGGVVD